jgi:hypothetical protein
MKLRSQRVNSGLVVSHTGKNRSALEINSVNVIIIYVASGIWTLLL